MKIYTYVVMIVGIMIFLGLAGINSTTGYVLGTLGLIDNAPSFQDTGLFNAVIALFTAVGVGGLVIGFFTKTSPESYLIIPFVLILMVFIGDLISLIAYVNSLGTAWIGYVVLMILAPLIVGYLVAIVEWWRGVD